ncbi:MAG: hypothetical protein ACI9FZ_000512 [Bacteroidia bacterium]|jgi:hypothetical protein
MIRGCGVKVCSALPVSFLEVVIGLERSVGDSPTFIPCCCKGRRLAPLSFTHESTMNLFII